MHVGNRAQLLKAATVGEAFSSIWETICRCSAASLVLAYASFSYLSVSA